MSYVKKNNQPVLGENEDCVPFKAWQHLPPFKFMHDYTRKQNLGQTYNGIEKYRSMANGKNTGHGYAFEDLTKMKFSRIGYNVEKINASKNGADYLVNGRLTQMKCCNNNSNNPGKSGAETARKFCVGNNLRNANRYPGQDACVPQGEAKYVREAFKNRAKNGIDKAPAVIESPVSVPEAIDYTYKGKKSFMMDIKDPNLVNPAMIGGIVVGGATYFAARQKILANCKKKGKEMTWKQKLLAAGLGILSAGTSTIGFLHIGCSARQNLRPMKA